MNRVHVDFVKGEAEMSNQVRNAKKRPVRVVVLMASMLFLIGSSLGLADSASSSDEASGTTEFKLWHTSGKNKKALTAEKDIHTIQRYASYLKEGDYKRFVEATRSNPIWFAQGLIEALRTLNEGDDKTKLEATLSKLKEDNQINFGLNSKEEDNRLGLLELVKVALERSSEEEFNKREDAHQFLFTEDAKRLLALTDVQPKKKEKPQKPKEDDTGEQNEEILKQFMNGMKGMFQPICDTMDQFSNGMGDLWKQLKGNQDLLRKLYGDIKGFQPVKKKDDKDKEDDLLDNLLKNALAQPEEEPLAQAQQGPVPSSTESESPQTQPQAESNEDDSPGDFRQLPQTPPTPQIPNITSSTYEPSGKEEYEISSGADGEIGKGELVIAEMSKGTLGSALTKTAGSENDVLLTELDGIQLQSRFRRLGNDLTTVKNALSEADTSITSAKNAMALVDAEISRVKREKGLMGDEEFLALKEDKEKSEESVQKITKELSQARQQSQRLSLAGPIAGNDPSVSMTAQAVQSQIQSLEGDLASAKNNKKKLTAAYNNAVKAEKGATADLQKTKASLQAVGDQLTTLKGQLDGRKNEIESRRDEVKGEQMKRKDYFNNVVMGGGAQQGPMGPSTYNVNTGLSNSAAIRSMPTVPAGVGIRPGGFPVGPFGATGRGAATTGPSEQRSTLGNVGIR